MIDAPFIETFTDVIDHMYSHGWDERNAGNVSYILTEADLEGYLDLSQKGRPYKLQFEAPSLIGKYFLVTGSGKFFKNVKKDVKANACVLKVVDKNTVEILWGLKETERPTSELSTHLSVHMARLKKDPTHRVVIHTHATYVNAMSAVVKLDEKTITKKLWSLNTENIIIFPEGVGIVPWEIPGNEKIGAHTAEKFETFKVVMWPLHGIVASGDTLDHTYGLIETVEKAAHMYLAIRPFKQINYISDKDLLELAAAFDTKPNEAFIK